MKRARPTPLDTMIERYWQKQRSLGRGYANEERVLISLHGFVKKAGSADLNQKIFQQWCKSQEKLTANVRRQRQRIVRNYCLYRQRTEPNCFVPDPSHFPRRCPHALPVIFGPAEVARMLAAAKALTPTAGSPLRPAVMRLAIIILFTAGLRRGELLRLTLADVDLEEGVLRIDESKFHKSRFVPLSPDAHGELCAYLKKRLTPPLCASPKSPAMYMGHVSIVSTAYYLQWIPELAEAASRRFARHFGQLIRGTA
jgi:integrase/recombinase XerD